MIPNEIVDYDDGFSEHITRSEFKAQILPHLTSAEYEIIEDLYVQPTTCAEFIELVYTTYPTLRDAVPVCPT